MNHKHGSKKKANKTKVHKTKRLPDTAPPVLTPDASGPPSQLNANEASSENQSVVPPRTSQQPESTLPVRNIPSYYKLLFSLRVIRVELIITIFTVLLSIGQYFENVISVRVNISSIWREGYKPDIRNRVQKFRLVNDEWKKRHHLERNTSVDMLVYPSMLFAPGCLRDDEFIRNLLVDDVPREAVDKDYIKAALEYRNAIIDTLNTAEAVKAVIKSRPWPFNASIFYWDTLEDRYVPVVEDLRIGLEDFIVSYQNLTKDRPLVDGRRVPAWNVLTSPLSNIFDYLAIPIFVLIGVAFLAVVYFAKSKYKKFYESSTEFEVKQGFRIIKLE
jgi:hypothetical protein